jgi:hypothetical protein
LPGADAAEKLAIHRRACRTAVRLRKVHEASGACAPRDRGPGVTQEVDAEKRHHRAASHTMTGIPATSTARVYTAATAFLPRQTHGRPKLATWSGSSGSRLGTIGAIMNDA